jgi:hypothetical protein
MGNIEINFTEIGYRMWSGFNWPLCPCHKKTQFLNVVLQFGGCLSDNSCVQFVISFLEGYLGFSLKSDKQSKKSYICLHTVLVKFPGLFHS